MLKLNVDYLHFDDCMRLLFSKACQKETHAGLCAEEAPGPRGKQMPVTEINNQV